MDEPRSIAPAPQELYPQDPIATLSNQEPRSLSVPAEAPGTPQSVGVGVADIPSRLVGGDGIAVEVSGLDYLVRMDIAPLQVDAGDPRQQWVPVWTEGHPFDATYRVPVAAIPADAPKDHIVYGRQDGSWVPAIENVTISWDDIQGVPGNIAYLPIAQADVTQLVEDQDFQDAAIAANTTKNTEQDGRLDAVETKNTTQDTAINGKEPIIAAGTTSQFWRGDKSWQPLSSITVDAWTKAESDAKYEPIIATGNPAYFWAGDKTWKATAPFPEAPTTGLVYGRRGQDASWQTILAGATLSDTPPSSPVAGQFWVETDTGGFFTYWADADSSQWVQLNAFPSLNGYVQKSGDTMVGDLTISKASPLIVLDKSAATQHAAITGKFNGLHRWFVSLGAAVAESGGNAGSDFAIYRYNDAGTFVDSPLSINRATGVVAATGLLPLTGGSISGTLSVASSLTATGGITIGSGAVIGFSGISNFSIGYGGGSNFTTGTGVFQFMFAGTAYYYWSVSGNWPLVDNAYYLGKSGNRWYQIWSAAALQTSDEREKRDVRPLDEKERIAAQAIKGLIRAYRWKPEAVHQDHPEDAEKINIGVMAQDIERALILAGLDPNAYSMWRTDPVMRTVKDAEGKDVEEPTGEVRYAVEYTQILAFIIGAM